MADEFSAYKEQAKATIGKIMGTRPIAVEGTATFASNPSIDTVLRSELISIANELARDFSELGKVPKMFEPQASLRDDVQALLGFIRYYSNEIDALFSRTQSWDTGLNIQSLPTIYNRTKNLVVQIESLLRSGAFKDVPKTTKSEFIAKREILYKIIGEKYYSNKYVEPTLAQILRFYEETQDALYHNINSLPRNIMNILNQNLMQLQGLLQICGSFVEMHEPLKKLLDYEPTSQIESSFTERADKISTVAIEAEGKKREITALYANIQQLAQQIHSVLVQMQQNGVSPTDTQQTNAQGQTQTDSGQGREPRQRDPSIIDIDEMPDVTPRGQTTPPPTPVNPETVRAAQVNDAEVERIIQVLNTFRNDFLPRQAAYAQSLEQLFTQIHELRGDVASLNSKSTQEAYGAVSNKLAAVRLQHGKIKDDIASNQPLAQQFANTLVRESDTLETAHTKLKLLFEEKDENLNRDLRRGFNEVISHVKDIVDGDKRLKEKLATVENLLEVLQTQIDSRQSDAAEVARALEAAAQQAKDAAQKNTSPIKKSVDSAKKVTETATASKKRASASVMKRAQLDSLARAYKDKRQTLLLNMELIVRQRLNLNPYNKPSAKGAEDSFRDQATKCMRKVQKTFAADKELNMKDLTRGLKKGLVEINDALGLFMLNMPEAVVAGLPQESHLLETLINDFGKIESELETLTKK